jgi:probable rRNA maturation factor
MKVNLINQQPHPLHLEQLERTADQLARHLPERTGAPWSEVNILLLDDEGIARYNAEYFSKDRPTDVISFRYDPIPGEEPAAFSGDLLINVERALEAGPAHQGGDYELALYVAHGIDHLTGSEDDTPEKRTQMLQRETEWLKTLQENGNALLFFPNSPTDTL